MPPLVPGGGFDRMNVGGKIEGFIGNGLVMVELLVYALVVELVLLRSFDFPLRLQAVLVLLVILLGTIEHPGSAMLLALPPTLFTNRGKMKGGLVVVVCELPAFKVEEAEEDVAAEEAIILPDGGGCGGGCKPLGKPNIISECGSSAAPDAGKVRFGEKFSGLGTSSGVPEPGPLGRPVGEKVGESKVAGL